MQTVSLPVVNALIFARVSTSKQNTDRQVAELTKLCAQKNWLVVVTITEYISGATKNNERPEVEKLLTLAQSGTIQKVVVSEVSRLGRKLTEAIDLIEQLTRLKVSIYIQNIGMETLLENRKENFMFKPILVTLISFAEVERELTKERITSGIAERQRKGLHFGRTAGSTKSDAKLLKEYARIVKDLNCGISLRRTAKLNQVGVNTVRKVQQIANSQGLLKMAEPTQTQI